MRVTNGGRPARVLGPVTGAVMQGRGLSIARLRERVERDAAGLGGPAACREASVEPNAWTPEYEEERVPAQLRRICDSCPVWEACLVDALRMNDIGYRASMTTRQRREQLADLIPVGRAVARTVSVPTRRGAVDRDRTPTHSPGAGSLNAYRRGCRCDECRGHNAAARRRERARAS